MMLLMMMVMLMMMMVVVTVMAVECQCPVGGHQAPEQPLARRHSLVTLRLWRPEG
jgi:hypothetical protein